MKYAMISLIFTAALHAQNAGMAFQNVMTFSPDRAVTLQTASRDVITGRPVAATEERHTLQVLGDGTRIETKSSNKYYRDEQGRTRIEREDGSVVISDPVHGVAVEIKKGKVTGRSFRPPAPVGVNAQTKELMDKNTQMAIAERLSALVNGTGAASRTGKLQLEFAATKQLGDEENLGLLSVNGVLAQGTRSVTTIPLGLIGNDRPIDIVNERWVSNDLQMTIKSSNKDPRFGETTYELTNIQQGNPDPLLFLIPANK